VNLNRLFVCLFVPSLPVSHHLSSLSSLSRSFTTVLFVVDIMSRFDSLIDSTWHGVQDLMSTTDGWTAVTGVRYA
jgi:hypothetical protein